MTQLNPIIDEVTDRIRKRSEKTRAAYLAKIEAAHQAGPVRTSLSCGNLAHGFAACGVDDKKALKGDRAPNIGIITAFNDMLSAHQPFESYPEIIKQAARDVGAVAQVAGGVPAMCDGVTQGQPGMELSLFSRDVIAMSAAVGLSHNMFDAALYLGVCDKIVPGLLIAALTFGHIPTIFVPAGPMGSGLSNKEKARIRELYAKGEIGKDELLESESKAYHSAGTCTFYGTANSNQALLEVMGLLVPGSAFAPPGTALRDAVTKEATYRVAAITALGNDYRPIGRLVDERSIVNAIAMLLATGGSTNHTLHWIAIAEAAGIKLSWQDMDELSQVVPLMARVYPNGQADVNHMDQAGGLPFIISKLADHGLVHEDAVTTFGDTLGPYRRKAKIADDLKTLEYEPELQTSANEEVLRPPDQPFQSDGGLRLVTGNLGRAIVKTSAVAPEHWMVEAPCQIFDDQNDMLKAFEKGELHKDVVVVVRGQGPKANGMPELHKLTPPLSVLQNLGFKVALVTDGRMSGASGKVPSAIHVTPESSEAGPLAMLRTGDKVRLDIKNRTLKALVEKAEWENRSAELLDLSANSIGIGRELFSIFRQSVRPADEGASVFSNLQSGVR